MEQSGIFKDKRLQILRVNPTDYDLAGRLLYWFDRMPSLYLLDKDKRVILKDATIEETEEKLHEILK